MIGAFARRLGPRDRILSYEETGEGVATTARTPEGVATLSPAADAPPEAFAQKLEHDGGNVYVVPMLEALREWLRKSRKPATLSGVSENAEYPSDPKESP